MIQGKNYSLRVWITNMIRWGGTSSIQYWNSSNEKANLARVWATQFPSLRTWEKGNEFKFKQKPWQFSIIWLALERSSLLEFKRLIMYTGKRLWIWCIYKFTYNFKDSNDLNIRRWKRVYKWVATTINYFTIMITDNNSYIRFGSTRNNVNSYL